MDEADVRLRCRDDVAFGPDSVAYSAKALLSGWGDHPAGRHPPPGQRVLLRILAAAAQPRLALVGLDCSVGHQLNRFQLYEREVHPAVDLLAAIRNRHGLSLGELNLGGGRAVTYSHTDAGFALSAFTSRIRAVLRLTAERHEIRVPRLTVSPGRAIVSRAGITLYHVVSVSRDENGHRLVAVDGGVSDCPAGAHCGGQHGAVLFGRTSRADPVRTTAVGRHNEADGVVVPGLDLPSDVHPGDLVAVAGTGAYHHSRACAYQLVGRPALVGVRDGAATTLVRRESLADLLARDVDGED